MNFGRDGFYDPFETDDAGDRMDFKQALTLVNEEVSNFNFMENDMDEPKAKKTVSKKPAAEAKPAEAAVKKTVNKPAAKPAEAKAATKPAAKKADAKANGPRGLSIPEGFVGLEKIAKDLKTDPAALRRKLRAAEGIEKPTIGVWAWKEGSKDLDKVIKFLTPKAEK